MKKKGKVVKPLKGFEGKILHSFSLRNEKKVLLRLHFIVKTQYDKYETSYEEDLEMLKKEDLT